MLRPFFTYYGGKWRAAPLYPAPQHDVIVEPFAGSAGYALRHPHLGVLLVDVDPVIVGVWDYLIHATESDIRALPLEVESVDDIAGPQEARWLVGFWLNKGMTQPCKRPSAWMRRGYGGANFWGETIRDRILAQLPAIRHWRVLEASYADLPNAEATWFVDPPYATWPGRRYRFSDVDYAALAEWCQGRRGQVIVCEQDGSSWLPFREFHTIKANYGGKMSREVVWTNA